MSAPEIVAVLFRGCPGCGRNVPLDEWQEGQLGCDPCRARAERAANDVPRINAARSPARHLPS